MPIYMSFEGIEGPMTGKYAKWIELSNAVIRQRREGTVGSAGGGGIPEIAEVEITKQPDRTTSRLYDEYMAGRGRKVTIVFTKSKNDEPYLKIELEAVIVSSYSVNGRAGTEGGHLESWTLNYGKIKYTTPAAPVDRREPVGYDLTTARPY